MRRVVFSMSLLLNVQWKTIWSFSDTSHGRARRWFSTARIRSSGWDVKKKLSHEATKPERYVYLELFSIFFRCKKMNYTVTDLLLTHEAKFKGFC